MPSVIALTLDKPQSQNVDGEHDTLIIEVSGRDIFRKLDGYFIDVLCGDDDDGDDDDGDDDDDDYSAIQAATFSNLLQDYPTISAIRILNYGGGTNNETLMATALANGVVEQLVSNKNRSLETINAFGMTRDADWVLLQHVARFATGGVALLDTPVPTRHLPHVVSTMMQAVDNNNLKSFMVRFSYEMIDDDDDDERSTLNHIWSAAAGLEELSLDLIVSDDDPEMIKFEEEDLVPLPSLKTLIIVPSRSEISTTDEKDDDDDSVVDDDAANMPATVRKLYMSLHLVEFCCPLLETFTYNPRMVDLAQSTRKQIFLDCCNVMAKSLTIKDVLLPCPSKWWQDKECMNAALKMVRTNRHLIKFQTMYDDDGTMNEDLRQARREIDFWLWFNAHVENEEELLKGTTIGPSLWPNLIARLMMSEEKAKEEEAVKKRTACYYLLKQRVDLVAYGSDR